MNDRPFLISGILGLGAVIMTLVFTVIGPRPTVPLAGGFLSPILAFEFATTSGQVEQLFVPLGAPAGMAVRASMDRLNSLDFLYITFYGGCLIAFALVCARLTGQRRYTLAAALAAGIMLADVLENVQLLAITRQLGTASIDGRLVWLRLFTWLKWGGLALWFVLLWPYFRGRPGLARLIAPLSFLPALLAAVAFIRPGLPSELFALSIGLMFLLLAVYAWFFKQPRAALAMA